MLRKFLLIGASALAFASSALAASPPDDIDVYQLQERCGNDAAAFFAREKQFAAQTADYLTITDNEPIKK